MDVFRLILREVITKKVIVGCLVNVFAPLDKLGKYFMDFNFSDRLTAKFYEY